MTVYCEQCDNRCPMDNLQCGRGRRAAGGEDRYERDDHRREGHPELNERRRFDHGPEFDRRHEFDHGPEHGRPRGPEFDRHHGSEFEGHHGPEFDQHHGPEFDRRHGPGFEGHHGPEFDRHHGPEFDRGPRGGRRPPMPDREMLAQRIESAELPELLRLSGRLMPEGHGSPARGQALILSILAGRESLSQRELQQLLGVRPGSVSETVTKLERKGLLTREKGDDRRGNLLRITDQGREAIPQNTDAIDDPFDVLDTEQRGQLSGLLKTLLNHWIDNMD